jgi:HPt (histidine-containing phosphotransfer) domain-containing protein
VGDIVYIDQEDGKKRVMNNAKLYAKLLGTFCNGTKIEPIFAALEAGNYEEAQSLAHAIKGTSANLSLKDFFEKIVQLEAQIKAKSVDPLLIEEVKASFTTTLSAAEKVIEENA